MLSRSIEDYIKAIYRIEADGERASTKRIAQRLDVKMASVTGMIKHLAAEGYVRHVPYRGVELSKRGHHVAIDVIRRHRIIELFLVRTLDLSWDEVDADAEILEHAVSDRLIERMYEFLGRPEFDPHGAPIPAKGEAIPPHDGATLDQLAVGAHASIVEVSDRDPAFLRYLTSLKLTLGSEVEVTEHAPFDGPLTVRLADRKIAIGREACSRIRVKVTRKPGRPAQKRHKARR